MEIVVRALVPLWFVYGQIFCFPYLSEGAGKSRQLDTVLHPQVYQMALARYRTEACLTGLRVRHRDQLGLRTGYIACHLELLLSFHRTALRILAPAQ